MAKKLVFTGGGTGGHIYPAITIAREVLELEPEAKILYIGGKGRRESRIVPRYKLDFVSVPVESFPRSLSLRWFKVAWNVPMGLIKSLMILRKFSPRVVIGTGGYVCGPVLLGASLLHIPILIQEQNAMPGLTNRIMGRWAAEIYIPFLAAAKFFPAGKTRVTGNPVRPEIVTASSGREKLGLKKNKMTISFVGGSQGASSINSAAVGAFKRMTEFSSQIQIIHQTGEQDFQDIKKTYDDLPFEAIVQPYFHSIEDVYSATDLIVCRAGASTLAEVTALGLPAVLIPHPFAWTGQPLNAEVLKKSGAAVVIRNDQLTGERLADVLISLIKDKGKLSEMARNSRSLGSSDAAHEIAERALLFA